MGVGRNLSSLRFSLPLLLLAYCGVIGAVLYVAASRSQEQRVEQQFLATQLIRATELQSRTERAAERSELETAQREFYEIGALEALRAAVFVAPDNRVLLTSRREWANRAIDLAAFGLGGPDQAAVEQAMAEARASQRSQTRFTADREGLALVLPAALPRSRESLQVDRRALIVLVYDLALSKAVNRFHLQRQFALTGGGLLLAVFGLGVGLHFVVTRRLEQVRRIIGRFAAGEPVADVASRMHDEIADIRTQFGEMAGVVQREMAERQRADAELRRVNRALRTISHCNQALVHATDEESLLNEICRGVVDEGGYKFAWVGFTAGGRIRTDAIVAKRGDDQGYLVALRAAIEGHALEQNPAVTALGTGQPVVLRDYETEPSVALWRHEALARGFRSSVLLPLIAGGQPLGVLTIYSGEANAFDDHELAMLNEMAADLAYGLQALRTRQRHAQAEIELAAGERRLRQLIRYTPAAVAMFDREMRYIEASDRWLSDYRLQGREVVGCSHYEVFPDVPERWKAVHQRVLAGAVERCDEDPFPRADGTLDWLAWEVRPWHQADGSIGGLTMFTQLITDRKRAEHELRESQSKLMIAMDMAQLAPWEFDALSGEFLFNDTFYALLRTTAEAEGGYTMPAAVYAQKFLPPEEAALVQIEIDRSMSGADARQPRGIEHRFLRADGSTGTMLVRYAVVQDSAGRVIRTRGVNQDISDRRQREEALRISEERFRSAMSHSPIGMAIVSPDGRFAEVNPALCAIVGYTREALVRTRFQALTHPDDLARDLELVQQLVDRRVEAFQIEKRYLHKRGYVVWTQSNVSLVRDEQGRPRYFVKQVQDITERKTAAAEMEALNARYARHEAAMATLTRSYVQSPRQFTDVLRVITEVVGRTLEVSRVGVWRANLEAGSFTCADLYEWPGDHHSSGIEVTGPEVTDYARTLAAADVVVATDAARDPRTAAFTAAHLSQYGVTSMIDIAVREQGELAAVLCCGHVGPRRKWTPDEQTFAVAVANLLSSLFAQVDRQHLEEQLRQAQKLEGIGQLAGGVAHDFNNVLTVILGKAGQLSGDPRLPADLREAADDITQSGERAANLTRQLLAFSRRQAMQVRDVDLNLVIRSVARMLERVLGEDLTLRFSFSQEPAIVSADAGMIDQVVLNLAINARDAMRRGGLLVVETALVELDATDAVRTGHRPGPYACLRVTDTGSGIAAENLPHIFEPFFTTKDVGKGTGLGLATTYGIVQQHGGWIDVDSEVGRGTTFRVFLPRLAQARPATPPATVAAAPRPATGRESILVVEDEAEVRSLIVEALSGYGYHVLQAASGPLAVEVWRQYGSVIDLLITDMVMPDGMNGLELAEVLKRANPGLRIIYISGYLADVSQEELLQSEGAAYLAKPFSLPSLARLVRNALDATENRRSLRH
ncbi:MAG: PAS domain S-box protein [Vicinamibacterales bacterium]